MQATVTCGASVPDRASARPLRRLWRWVIVAVLAHACGPGVATIQQPLAGPSQAPPKRSYTILGVMEKVVTFEFRGDSDTWKWYKNVEVEVPVRTQVIVPVPAAWVLALGQIGNSSDWATCLQGGGTTTTPCKIDWDSGDEPWAEGDVIVDVKEIEPPDYLSSPPTQKAVLNVRARARGLDSLWGEKDNFAAVRIGLLLLGTALKPSLPPGPPGPKGLKGDDSAVPGPVGEKGKDNFTKGMGGPIGPRGVDRLLLAGGSGRTINGTTSFFEPVFYSDADTFEPAVQQELPLGGTLRDFSVWLDVPPGAARTMTFIVRKGIGPGSPLADTPVRCTIGLTAATPTSCTDPSNTVAFAPGDQIAVRSFGNSAATPKMRWSATYVLP